MKKLLRRVAVGLALPLVVGVPMVLLASPAQAWTTTITSAVSSAPTSVYGQEVRVTATVVTDGAQPVTEGSVQFFINRIGNEEAPLGAAVPLDAAGKAVSPALEDGGAPLDITQGSDFYAVRARFDPLDSTFDTSSGTVFQFVDMAGSSLAVLPGPTSIVADMSGQLPGGVQAGSAKPSGTVTFTVGGAPVGSALVAGNGRATLNFVVPPGAPRQIYAAYDGDDRYTASMDTLTRVDPEITARVLSKFPKSKSGWYRTPVEVLFTCRPHGSELAEDCPAQVTLKKSDEGQSVSRTIHANDGGTATAVVDGIDIDRAKPEVSVVDGKCKATDKLSGVKSCKLRVGSDGRHFIAIATDKAGNRAVLRGVLPPSI
jgi:Bacterial Ig-like domain (group 3)